MMSKKYGWSVSHWNMDGESVTDGDRVLVWVNVGGNDGWRVYDR